MINKSKNTIYLDDIDHYLPYRNDEIEEIEPDMLRRSRSLRGFILSGMLEIVEYDESERIEKSILYLKKKIEAKKEEIKDTPKKPEQFLDVPPDQIEIKFHGIFFDAGGYAKVNRNVALKLNEAGFIVKVDPKRGQNQLKEDELYPFVQLQKTVLSRNHISIDSIIPSFAEMSSGKYKILYTTIESYTVPDQFVECCQLYNEIWMTSPFGAEILSKYVKDKPIYVMNAGIDETLYKETGSKFDFRPNVKDFVFISVFGWNYRKGWDVLLRAFFDEFNANDSVSLIIVSRYQSGQSKYHRNKIKTDIESIMEEFPNKDLPHVVRYSKITPEKDMPKLYRSANCFVLPTRGEGSCCVPGTKIVTNTGIKDIEAIIEGECVLTHKRRFQPVIRTMCRSVNTDIYSIYTSMNGATPITLTEEHPVLIVRRSEILKNGKKQLEKFNLSNCEWIKTENLVPHDYVVHPLNSSSYLESNKIITKDNVKNNDYLFLPIKKIEKYHYNGMVYNLEVDKDNSYTTDFIVHNCLTSPEASLCGLPIIMTNVSGQQMYLREDNAYPIEMDRIKEVERGAFGIHYWDGQQFPDLTSKSVHNQLCRTMREVVENYEEAKQRNKKLQKLILDNFTWDITIQKMSKRLIEISEKLEG